MREVMRTNVVALPADAPPDDWRRSIGARSGDRRGQHLYPVVDTEDDLIGVVTRQRPAGRSGTSRPVSPMTAERRAARAS